MMPMAISQQPATRVRIDIESIGEMISTPPPITMITPESACQPRPGRWSKDNAAAKIYCHPNTVRHRLHRIEELTDRSLSRPKDVAELCLAFEVELRLP